MGRVCLFIMVFVLWGGDYGSRLAMASAKEDSVKEETAVLVARGESQRVGRRAASRVLNDEREYPAHSEAKRALWVHGGSFISSDAKNWGPDGETEDLGKWNAGVTYQMSELDMGMDVNIRFDFTGYSVRDPSSASLELTSLTKFSPVVLVTFPEARKQFPLYFGLGIGPGFFFDQVGDEHSITIDYQLVGGLRLNQLLGDTGVFVEAGLKNHVQLSDSSFFGVFASAGAHFLF